MPEHKQQESILAVSSDKQGVSTNIQDKSGKCLTEEQKILSRWKEYCIKLYSYGEDAVLDCNQPPEKDLQAILREELEVAVVHRKRGSLPELIPQNIVKQKRRS